MPSFNGSDIERIDRTDIGDNRKVQGRCARNVDSSVCRRSGLRTRNGREGCWISSRGNERPKDGEGGGGVERKRSLSFYRDARIGDEAVCCAREFTAEIPLTD